MATERWQTTFDLIGLTAYLTLMTGALPDSKLLAVAREGTGPKEVILPTKSRAKSKTKRRRARRAVAA